MRKIRLFFGIGILATSFSASYAETQLPLDTDDRFVISDLKTDSDGNKYVTIGLDGVEDRLYCAFNMEISLPVGMTFAVEEGTSDEARAYMCDTGDMYPHQGSKYYHTLTGVVHDNGRLARVACYSASNKDLLHATGDLFDIYLNVNEWTKAGANQIRLTGLNLTEAENAQKYIPVGDLNTGVVNVPGENRRVSVCVPEGTRHATIVLPFSYVLPAELKAYSFVTIKNDKACFEEVERIEAYTPFLLKALNGGYEAEWIGTADADSFPASLIGIPATADAYVGNDNFVGVLAPGNPVMGYTLNGAEFRAMPKVAQIETGSAFLNISPKNNPEILEIDLDFTTGIENAIEEPEVLSRNNLMQYDLNGRQVEEEIPGMVIVSSNGKKIVTSR